MKLWPFGRKKASLGAPKPAASKPAAPALTEAPAYYEVWGGLESANRALWMALWLSTTMVLLCLILVRLLITRPPLVIRVSDSGAAQALPDPGRQPAVSQPEIKNFITLFEKFFWGLNWHTYQQDLDLAFSMMTQNCRRKADQMLKRDGIVDALKANQSRITVTLTDLKVVRDTPDILECRVLGSRQTTSYKQDGAAGETVFEHDIVLRKTPRSEAAPYGVLVEDFQESVYKK